MSHLLRSLVFSARARPWWASRVPLLAVSVAALCAASCGGLVEVGEAKDDPSDVPVDGVSHGGDDGAGDVLPPVEPTPPALPAPMDCTDADRGSREPYEAWTQLANDFGALSGRTFAGYVEGGPDLSLVIDESGNATLSVGEPAPPPEADASYLCGNARQDGHRCTVRYGNPPVEGGVYPLHGATFAADRLIAPIQPNAPYDAWCALQTPHTTDVCSFATVGLRGFSVTPSTGECLYDDQSVDCGWLELAQAGVCRCTSSDCFADIDTNTPIQIEARFDQAKQELSGTFIDGDRARSAIHLFEVVE